ncbi:MAG: DUF4129 domain-containing protein [Planctomycetia bacterium]|nr:DUF4129 domain-containing protein [Planctomycetia bacterium]
MSRPQPTLADYMAIAISPALIMVLVGSLSFFLLHVFYSGEYASRLHWVTGCFVFAAVLISRVSIEEGAERASLFGLALGVVAALAMIRFVNHPWWAWLVLGIIWWCASHLVWNCTLVDDAEDASGEGLLEAAGLDAALSTEPAVAPPTAKGKPDTAARKSPGANRKREAAPPQTPSEATPRPLWRRALDWWQGQRKRTAPPGLWVVYFSLAALPIFGIGQIFIPKDDRAYAFRLACQYVGSGLGLLLMTSFLGLRRYLRQRKLEMPVEMAGAWLGVGGAMAVAILIVAALVPRPNAEYAISSLSGMLGSPSRQASPYSPMRSDPGQGQSPSQAPANDQTNVPQDPQQQWTRGNPAPSPGRSRPGEPDSGTTTGTGQPSGSPTGEAKSSSGGSDDKSSGSNGQSQDTSSTKASGSGSSGSQPSQGQQVAPGRQSAPQQAQDENAERRDQSSDAKGKPTSAQNPPQPSPGGARGGPAPAAGSPQPTPPPPQAAEQQQPAQPRFKMPSFSGSWLLPILKVLLYLGVLYCVWRFWPEISAWLARLWQEFLDLWRSLFGGRRTAAEEAQEAEAARSGPRPFAAFNDPFASGEARRHPANTIVWYSFEALEAWAAERELGRQAEETPLEFAARLAEERPALAADVRELASLYARVAYARETLSSDHLEGVERLWTEMRRAAEQFAPA